MRIQPAPKPLSLVHVNTEILADSTLTPSESIAWAVACSNHAFWCIRLNEIAKRSGCSEKSVQRAFTKKRKSGELLALKLRQNNGTFSQMIYIIHHKPLSQHEWISQIQDIDFEKWTQMCFNSVNTSEQRDKFITPKLNQSSKYDLVYNRDGILEQRSKKHHPTILPSIDQLNDQSSFIDIDNKKQLFDYLEYIKFDSDNNDNTTNGQKTRVVKCPTNKVIKPKTNNKIQISDDDRSALKSTEKKLIPVDFKFDTQIHQRLEVENQIPSDFISNSLSRCIRHNRKKPPRQTVDFNNWAEKWVLSDWKKYTDQPDYLPAAQPMPKNWGLDTYSFNLILKDFALSEDDLIILIREYRNKFLNTGVLSYCWQSDFHSWIDDNFDSLLTMLYEKVA